MLRARTTYIIIFALLGIGFARPRASLNSAAANGAKDAIIPDGLTLIKEQAASKDEHVFGEPTCEQLRTMWRFSKRQARASEITNEIPSYRDPFVNNIWQAPYETYAKSRSGGMRLGGHRGIRPVYGRVVHVAPNSRVIGQPARNRAFEEVVRLYSDSNRSSFNNARRPQQFRFPGGYMGRNINVSPHSGSFQHLKELIKTERAHELQQQRIAEEMAARAAVLKAAAGKQDAQRRKYEQHNAKYIYGNGGDDDDNQVMNDEPSMRDYMMVSLDPDQPNDSAPPFTFPDPVAPPSLLSRDGRANWDKKDDDELVEFDFSDFQDMSLL